ncbi:hypothetical protein FA95DRAFT_1501976 [Auriscalpium vulgare]|uniref:Uncharacterized protein n=1 Tax=Auriscalpium vulgare TaxID=40419 RepID=A0ACB8RBS1_9AGAM|nr:hypothetical protein FA95DRAFT_1501976 [Auriscalpium vulgare]
MTGFNPNDPRHFLAAEDFWVEHRKEIEAAGYMLRPRYREGWKPSYARWKLPRKWFEDGQRIIVIAVIDGTRLTDGRQFIIKSVPPNSIFEEPITRLFSSEPYKTDPRNHCIPLEDTINLSGEPIPCLVLPMMRPYNNPRFRTFGEVVAFATQIFEGIEFMHKLHVAHRDCTGQNIVLDPSGMYPNSFHPVKINRTRNFHWFAKSYTRTQRPPRYYLIDFGLSGTYDPAEGPPRDIVRRGGDKSAPEHRNYRDLPVVDPFPTDIYYLGNLLREDFMNKYYGFEFLEPLVADMVQEDPSLRPKISVVVARFAEISAALTTWKLRSRLVGRKDSFILGPYRWIRHIYRTTGYILTRTPAVPMPRDEGPSRVHDTSKVYSLCQRL